MCLVKIELYQQQKPPIPASITFYIMTRGKKKKSETLTEIIRICCLGHYYQCSLLSMFKTVVLLNISVETMILLK